MNYGQVEGNKCDMRMTNINSGKWPWSTEDFNLKQIYFSNVPHRHLNLMVNRLDSFLP